MNDEARSRQQNSNVRTLPDITPLLGTELCEGHS